MRFAPRKFARTTLPVAVPLAIALLLALFFAAVGYALEVPFLSGRVVDEANIIPPEVEARITQELAAFEDSTGAQIAVLTIPSLEGEPLEDFTLRVVETWKLGRKGKDDGVLFFVAPQDRAMRIEVGYGAEGLLNDARAGRILAEVVRPRFREGDFGAGIEEGVGATLGFLRGLDPLPPEGANANTLTGREKATVLLFVFLVLGVFSMIALAAPVAQAVFLYLFLMPFYFAFPAGVAGLTAGLFSLGGWAIAFWILRAFFAHSHIGQALAKSMRSSGRSHGGFGGWGGGGGGWSSGGGGGFSGGGGSFGGGGASSSW